MNTHTHTQCRRSMVVAGTGLTPLIWALMTPSPQPLLRSPSGFKRISNSSTICILRRRYTHMCIRTHACTYMHTYACTHTHTCKHTHIRVHIHLRTHTHLYTRTYTYIHTHTQILPPFIPHLLICITYYIISTPFSLTLFIFSSYSLFSVLFCLSLTMLLLLSLFSFTSPPNQHRSTYQSLASGLY